MNYQTRQLIDAVTGGSLSDKYPDRTEQLFEDMARNECRWAPNARAPLVTEIHKVATTIALEAKVDVLTRKFNLLKAE